MPPRASARLAAAIWIDRESCVRTACVSGRAASLCVGWLGALLAAAILVSVETRAEVRWIKSDAPLPKGMALITAGIEANNINAGTMLYVCRASHQGGVHPGKVVGGHCNFGWMGRELAARQYEVAVAAPGSHGWTAPGAAASPVVGGQEAGRPLLVCRAEHKTFASHGRHSGRVVDGNCHIGYDGREIVHADYEVLSETVVEARSRAPPAGGPRASRPATAAAPSGIDPPAAAAPADESRLALVIGNGRYAAFPRLANPTNDAADLAQALSSIGFKVMLGLDLTRAAMEQSLIEFARRARGVTVAVVFYAGHGLQHNGINYLVPVDADIADESDLRKLIQVQSILEDLSGASRVRILVIDACRDNDAVQQLTRRLPATRSAAFGRGLAPLGPQAEGTLVAFATQPNRVAIDGTGRNSPFTAALLKHIATPRLELRTLFTRVRSEVFAATKGAQRPEVSDSLLGEFQFN
jgi:hypothetical protein